MRSLETNYRELSDGAITGPHGRLWSTGPGQQMLPKSSQAASLITDHCLCPGIHLLDPMWPTTPPGSLSDGSHGDPAPSIKHCKRKIDWSHCSRWGRPTQIVAGGRGRLQPEPIIRLHLHDSSCRRQHELICMQHHGHT
jgi:hypothetical protein